jgi:hypothetical protein
MTARVERTWSPADVERLLALIREGNTSKQIAASMGLTKSCIDNKRHQLVILGRLEDRRGGHRVVAKPKRVAIPDGPAARMHPRTVAWLAKVMRWTT